MPAQFLRRLTGRQLASLTLGFLLIAALAYVIIEPRRSTPVPVPDRIPSSAAPKTYDAVLKRLDDRLAGARQQLRVQGDEWLVQERVANAAMARARLTGSFDDYAAAQSALDSAFATAPPGAGPHLTQASLAFSLHRLDRTVAMLDAIDRYAVPAEADTRTEVEAFRGDVAFYRGDYAEALRRYLRNDDAFRLAVYHSKTGDPEGALRALDRLAKGLRLPSAQFLAQIELQRGAIELQRGAWDKGQAHFIKADAMFPGWWLAQAHVAQGLALGGRRPEAIQRFDAVAARNDAPELMDALAALYRAQGDAANARAWADRAGAAWARRVEQLPEAAWGHAVEHELAFGEPKRALELARRDYAARPHGGSAIALGWALIANNRPAEALAVIKPVLSSAWVSPEQHLVASQAYLLLGQADAADAEQQRALKLNPRAGDPAASLIWFGH